MFKGILHYTTYIVLPPTCFSYTCGQPQGGALLQILFEPVHKYKMISLRICGLKYILKYKIQIKYCDKLKCVTNVLCSYYVICYHREIKEICVCLCVCVCVGWYLYIGR